MREELGNEVIRKLGTNSFIVYFWSMNFFKSFDDVWHFFTFPNQAYQNSYSSKIQSFEMFKFDHYCSTSNWWSFFVFVLEGAPIKRYESWPIHHQFITTNNFTNKKEVKKCLYILVFLKLGCAGFNQLLFLGMCCITE